MYEEGGQGRQLVAGGKEMYDGAGRISWGGGAADSMGTQIVLVVWRGEGEIFAIEFRGQICGARTDL